MFFWPEDRDKLEKIEKKFESLLTRLDSIGSRIDTEFGPSLDKILEKFDEHPDIDAMISKFRELIEKTESNMKVLNQMMLDLKGWVSMSRTVIKDSKKK